MLLVKNYQEIVDNASENHNLLWSPAIVAHPMGGTGGYDN